MKGEKTISPGSTAPICLGDLCEIAAAKHKPNHPSGGPASKNINDRLNITVPQ